MSEPRDQEIQTLREKITMLNNELERYRAMDVESVLKIKSLEAENLKLLEVAGNEHIRATLAEAKLRSAQERGE